MRTTTLSSDGQLATAKQLLIDGRQAAAMFGVSRAHLYRMMDRGAFPKPLRLGGAVRWRVDELRAWIDAGMPDRKRWEAMRDTNTSGGGGVR
ncbi:MAG: helix-turn-helix transcriptional regulator [Phycisphaerales bacterium]